MMKHSEYSTASREEREERVSSPRRLRLRAMVLAACFAAMLCLIAPISFPIGVIPITLSVFALFLASLILPTEIALISVFVYMALGAVGLPVFSSFRGGVQMLIGPTGGYLLAYPLMVLCVGGVRKILRCFPALLREVIGGIAALVVCYGAGTMWYCVVAEVDSFYAALAMCVLPYIPFDLAKLAVAILIAHLARPHIRALNRGA